VRQFTEILTAELISVSGGLLGGTFLASFLNEIQLIPGLLILLPGFLQLRGAISGSLSGRIAAGLFLGVVKPKFRQKIIYKNFFASFILAVVIALLLGSLATFMSAYFFRVASLKLIPIAVLAAFFSHIIEIPQTILVTLWLFKRGLDPNDIMGPYTTTIGDIVSIISLYLAILVVA
jgi:mgtE-like transporter